MGMFRNTQVYMRYLPQPSNRNISQHSGEDSRFPFPFHLRFRAPWLHQSMYIIQVPESLRSRFHARVSTPEQGVRIGRHQELGTWREGQRIALHCHRHRRRVRLRKYPPGEEVDPRMDLSKKGKMKERTSEGLKKGRQGERERGRKVRYKEIHGEGF